MRPCPNCGKDVNPNARFCPNCAFDMTKVPQNPAYAETQVVQSSACPNCGATVAPNAKFCPNCASPIAGGMAAAGGQNYQGGPGYQAGAGYPSPGAGYPGQGYGGPAYAPGAKSKLPIIIGAIVLLLLIGGGVAAYFLWFNKPSDSTSNTNSSSANRGSTPTPSEGPGEVAKKLLRALERADANAVRALVAKSMQSNVPKLVEDASSEIQEHGGVDTITITDEKVEGDTASLRFALKYKDGETREPERMGFIKEDGAWKLKDI